MPSQAHPLRQVVKQRFYVFASSRGFSREKSSSSLFTTFTREIGGQLHWFELQWDKNHKPYVVINFGNKANEIAGRLQRRRGGSRGCWFSTIKPWRDKVLSTKWEFTPDEVVTEMIESVEELESWWSEGLAGPHMALWAQN